MAPPKLLPDMPNCPQCGVSGRKGAKCKTCGIDLVYDAAGAIVGMEITVIAKCKFCGDSVPLSGLVPSYECGGCKKTDAITVREWADELTSKSRVNAGIKLGSRWSIDARRLPAPRCACGAWYPLPSMPIGQSVTARCACGRGLCGEPIPEWLRAELPNARGIYHETDDAPDAGGGSKLVMMVCPRCGGGLELTDKSERVSRCPHCSVDVFLPAELWERFHPKKPAARWVLVWSAPLLSAAEIAAGAKLFREH
jgi:hypothetical protein